MILTLARDNSGQCVGLRLPAEPADIAAAYEKLDAISMDDNAVADSTHMGLQIDKKRRQEMQDKRIALGHKEDDHEEALDNRYQRQNM